MLFCLALAACSVNSGEGSHDGGSGGSTRCSGLRTFAIHPSNLLLSSEPPRIVSRTPQASLVRTLTS